MSAEEKGALCILALMAIICLPLLGYLIVLTEPKCPPGSQSHYSRGWFCVVTPLEK